MEIKAEIIETKDGSHSLYAPGFDEIYHSRHGAIAESRHIFIRSGLEALRNSGINVFELGFGTGLNALLAWIYAESKGIKLNYQSIELYPVSADLVAKINYPDLIGHRDKFQKLHEAGWDEVVELSPHFSLHKIKGSVLDAQLQSAITDVIFFDAFSPEKQPELWTTEMFSRMYDMLAPEGILVTYCSKSSVRRNMEQAGMKVTKLPGPHGKREMVRAARPYS